MKKANALQVIPEKHNLVNLVLSNFYFQARLSISKTGC